MLLVLCVHSIFSGNRTNNPWKNKCNREICFFWNKNLFLLCASFMPECFMRDNFKLYMHLFSVFFLFFFHLNWVFKSFEKYFAYIKVRGGQKVQYMDKQISCKIIKFVWSGWKTHYLAKKLADLLQAQIGFMELALPWEAKVPEIKCSWWAIVSTICPPSVLNIYLVNVIEATFLIWTSLFLVNTLELTMLTQSLCILLRIIFCINAQSGLKLGHMKWKTRSQGK